MTAVNLEYVLIPDVEEKTTSYYIYHTYWKVHRESHFMHLQNPFVIYALTYSLL